MFADHEHHPPPGSESAEPGEYQFVHGRFTDSDRRVRPDFVERQGHRNIIRVRDMDCAVEGRCVLRRELPGTFIDVDGPYLGRWGAKCKRDGDRTRPTSEVADTAGRSWLDAASE